MKKATKKQGRTVLLQGNDYEVVLHVYDQGRTVSELYEAVQRQAEQIATLRARDESNAAAVRRILSENGIGHEAEIAVLRQEVARLEADVAREKSAADEWFAEAQLCGDDDLLGTAE